MRKFAIALYENEAESEDELNFKKNDLLQILNVDYMGMDGWWLCKLVKNSQVGLAAGNRLKLINDEKFLAKINSLLNEQSSQTTTTTNNTDSSISLCKFDRKTNSILSTSSSSSSSSSSCASTKSSSTSLNSTSTSLSSPLPLKLTNSLSKKINIDEKLNSPASPNPRLNAFSLQPQQNGATTAKLILPVKKPFNPLNTTKMHKLTLNPQFSASKSSFLTSSTENILNLKSNLKKSNISNRESCRESESVENDDDYDYDIPENNQPIEKTTSQTVRKSTSPTIDSGISTSSLISLNSDILNLKIDDTTSLSSSSNSSSSKLNRHSNDNESLHSHIDTPNYTKKLQLDYNSHLKQILNLTATLLTLNEPKSVNNLNSLKSSLNELKKETYDFLTLILKNLKQEHACFHPDLSAYNKFKSFYRQLKEFYLYLESALNKLDHVYRWSPDLISKDQELNELLSRVEYFNQLVNLLASFVESSQLFAYHSQTSSEQLKQSQNLDDYEYEYDNNSKCLSNDFDYEKIDDDDDDDGDVSNNDDYSYYCQIDEEEEKKSESQLQCLTLKKNEEKIKREIRIAAEDGRVSLIDQMLLKFYLKHVEENLSEINSIYELLMVWIGKDENEQTADDLANLDSLGNKLAINGHKLVFISDTLQRNLLNACLKADLEETSSCLSDSLKLYMLRLKTFSLASIGKLTKQQRLILADSLTNLLNASAQFKQIIIKYYFKSF